MKTQAVSLAASPLGDTVNPSDIVIIHNIHNGEEFETIPIDSYDSATKTITFKTDSFSTYALATNKKDSFKSDKTMGGKDTTSPQTGDNSNVAFWISLFLVSCASIIGATICGKKRVRYKKRVR